MDRARQGIHPDEPGLPVCDVRSAVAVLERRRRVRPVDGPELAPLIATGVAGAQRFTPHLERESGAVTAFAAGRGVLGRVAGRVVDVVVVPAPAAPLVPLPRSDC